MRLRPAGMVAALLAVIPLAAPASDADDALKLAARIASLNGLADAVVTLRAAPRDLPSSVPLPSASLLGSVSVRMHPPRMMSGGSGSTFVVSHPSMTLFYDAGPARATALGRYDAALQRAGWKRAPDWRARFPVAQGGFQPSLPAFDAWCAPDDKLSVIVLPSSDPSGFNVAVSAAQQATSLCSEGRFPAAEQPAAPSALPPLTAVPGVTIEHAGPASDGSTTGARILSSLGTGAVFDVFAKQLTAAGWKPNAATRAPGLVSQTFAKTVDGRPYVALLSVYALDATHFVALADVTAG